MDAKALAKSKRAHSLHHKKKNQPHQALKVPSIGSDDKKPSGKQAKERPAQPHGQQAKPKPHGPRPLPSNWERYDEDFDLGSEEAQSSSSQPSEFVAPKSKGADYSYLITEAKAQSQAHCSPDVLPSFDDFISDFTQDFGPMLASKGQSILSWIADDGFEFEGKTSTNIEAPFLSLNLNALAEQLSKAKLSERLYLEPDLLPLELIDDELPAHDEDKYDAQIRASEPETSSGASPFGYNQQLRTNVQQTSSSPTIVTGDIPIQTSEQGLNTVNQSTDKILQSQKAHVSILPKSVPERIIDSTSGKPPIFQAASVEAELDMLLSSLGESKVPESSGESSIRSPSSSAAVINIDDDIDNLLEETASLVIIDDRRVSDGLKVTSERISSAVDPSSNSELLDDFDSWLDTI